MSGWLKSSCDRKINFSDLLWQRIFFYVFCLSSAFFIPWRGIRRRHQTIFFFTERSRLSDTSCTENFLFMFWTRINFYNQMKVSVGFDKWKIYKFALKIWLQITDNRGRSVFSTSSYILLYYRYEDFCKLNAVFFLLCKCLHLSSIFMIVILLCMVVLMLLYCTL